MQFILALLQTGSKNEFYTINVCMEPVLRMYPQATRRATDMNAKDPLRIRTDEWDSKEVKNRESAFQCGIAAGVIFNLIALISRTFSEEFFLASGQQILLGTAITCIGIGAGWAVGPRHRLIWGPLITWLAAGLTLIYYGL